MKPNIPHLSGNRFWPVSAADGAYISKNKKALRARGPTKAEDWAMERLQAHRYRFKRERQWGWRVFDLWLSKLGVAVEVDGPEHVRERDLKRDYHDLKRSGILVMRVRNFDEAGIARIIERLATTDYWYLRRQRLGLLTKFQCSVINSTNADPEYHQVALRNYAAQLFAEGGM